MHTVFLFFEASMHKVMQIRTLLFWNIVFWMTKSLAALNLYLQEFKKAKESKSIYKKTLYYFHITNKIWTHIFLEYGLNVYLNTKFHAEFEWWNANFPSYKLHRLLAIVSIATKYQISNSQQTLATALLVT